MNVTLLTSCSRQLEELHSLTAPNKKEYCDKWNLNFVDHRLDINDKQWGWWFYRPLLWLEELQKIDDNSYLFFMGADTLITNQTIDIRTIATGEDFIISRDCNGINIDVFLVKKTEGGLKFLREIIENKTRQQNEQDCASKLIDTGKFNTKVINQRIFNSYLYSYYPQHPGNESLSYQEGDFVLHLPGMNVNKKISIFKEYLPKVIR